MRLNKVRGSSLPLENSARHSLFHAGAILWRSRRIGLPPVPEPCGGRLRGSRVDDQQRRYRPFAGGRNRPPDRDGGWLRRSLYAATGPPCGGALDGLRLLPEVWCAEVVHLTGVYSFPTIPTLIAAAMLRKPLVWSPRGALQRWAGSRRVAAKRLWEMACIPLAGRRTVLHVTSEQERMESQRSFRGLPRR